MSAPAAVDLTEYLRRPPVARRGFAELSLPVLHFEANYLACWNAVDPADRRALVERHWSPAA